MKYCENNERKIIVSEKSKEKNKTKKMANGKMCVIVERWTVGVNFSFLFNLYMAIISWAFET